MGRFETTAETYALYREPYPPAFFAAIADALDLKGTERLIDLGTGPGVLAIGLAPYVGAVLGVDPEPNMLAAARTAAALAGVDLPLIAGRAENLGGDVGTFDLITIGRALHWMDRPATLAVLDRILKPDGTILVCGAWFQKDDSNPWHETLERVVRAWAPGGTPGRHRDHDDWFEETPFTAAGAVETLFRRPVTPEALFARMLTRSVTSATVLGDRVDACRTELLAALAPYFPDGTREEALCARAALYRRR